jgi:hypothetical protein
VAEQEQQQQGLVAGGSAAGEAVLQAQQQQQPDVRIDSGFGGASQAGIFRKMALMLWLDW